MFSPGGLHPIADLPDLPKAGIRPPPAVESTLSVEPAAERALHGRIWCVGPAIYSASESFPRCSARETGSATLVGSPTGGDGIGALDPVFPAAAQQRHHLCSSP